MIHDRECEWQTKREKCSCGLHVEPAPPPKDTGGLGAAVRAARKSATGMEEPPTPKRGFA